MLTCCWKSRSTAELILLFILWKRKYASKLRFTVYSCCMQRYVKNTRLLTTDPFIVSAVEFNLNTAIWGEVSGMSFHTIPSQALTGKLLHAAEESLGNGAWCKICSYLMRSVLQTTGLYFVLILFLFLLLVLLLFLFLLILIAVRRWRWRAGILCQWKKSFN